MVTSRQRVSSRGIERTGLTDDEARSMCGGGIPPAQSLSHGSPSELSRLDLQGRFAQDPSLWSIMLAIGEAGQAI